MFLAGKVLLLEVLKNSPLRQLEYKRSAMAKILVRARAFRATGIIFFLGATSGKDFSDGGGGGDGSGGGGVGSSGVKQSPSENPAEWGFLPSNNPLISDEDEQDSDEGFSDDESDLSEDSDEDEKGADSDEHSDEHSEEGSDEDSDELSEEDEASHNSSPHEDPGDGQDGESDGDRYPMPVLFVSHVSAHAIMESGKTQVCTWNASNTKPEDLLDNAQGHPFQVGAVVVLTPEGEKKHRGQSEYFLGPNERGVVTKSDGSSQPYEVKGASGHAMWYAAGEVQLETGAQSAMMHFSEAAFFDFGASDY
jgi:hypothetical protein